MAKISTYPIVSTPTLNDLLIGTDAEDMNNTRNFPIGEVIGLVGCYMYVPYTGACSDVDLGVYGIEGEFFKVNGGTSAQFLKGDGTLDSTVYQIAGDYMTGLSGEATASGPGVSNVILTNSAVIGKVLTGLTISGGTISDTDNILSAFGKVQNQINGIVSGLDYQGLWNADTNDPALASGVGINGHYYIVGVAGNTDLDGITDWNVGDWVIFNGSDWQKIDNTDTVVSVNGKVGIVVLTTTDIAEGTRLYYTDERARGAISLTTLGESGVSTYSNITGVLNIPNYTISGIGGVPSTRKLTINGTEYDLSADRSWSVGTVTSISTSGPITGGPITGSGTIGITQSGTSTDGYLSSIDWNIFNNKQNALTNPVTGTGTIYYLPMWASVSSLGDSIISQGSDIINFNFNTATGSTINYINTNGVDYTYTIQMNNATRVTYHSYTDGSVFQQINSNVVSKNLATGQLVLPYYTATTSFTGVNVGYLGFNASGDILTVPIPSLTGYVPYTGATANVNLGEFELMASQFKFDLSPTGTVGVGVMRWNDTDGTVDLVLKGGNVTLQIGQEEVQRVVNKSGIALNEAAYQVVRVTDAQGQRLAVDLAQGDSDANSTDTIGIVTETIAVNQEGFITTSGLVREINTTGSLQGETWVDGDVLYLSPITAGAITNIKPVAPNHTVILGYVVYAHINHGKIFVKCDNGYEIGELHNCYLPSPSNNDGIFWNSSTLRYENKSIITALGYTPYNATNPSGFVNYNIYTSDGTLSADRTVTGNGKNIKFEGVNGLHVSSNPHTNEVALFVGTEPNIHVKVAAGAASNSASLFLSPSAGFYGAIHNRTGGGLEFYVGTGPSVAMTLGANLNLGIGLAPNDINALEVGISNKFSASFIGNLGGARTPSQNYGLHIGWNYATSGESNIIWGTGNGTNPYLTFSSWDGASKVDRFEIQNNGNIVFKNYTSLSSFPGTPVGLLGFDSNGNIITVAATGGGGSGTVTSIATTGPITGGTITTSGTIGITQSGLSSDGYLSSTDWNTFNNKIGLTDGDKGDITVSGSGLTWTIDNATIGIAKLSATGTPSSSSYLRGDNTWASISASPAGSNGEIQFNNSSSFGADSNLFWDNTNKRLGIGISLPTTSIHTAGSVTATGFFESSDARLKSDILDYGGGNLALIKAKIYTKNGRTEIGYLAQDVENIYSSAVMSDNDGYKHLSYREVHTAKIASLENEIEQLKSIINGNNLGSNSK